jgi:hypothetical protein
MELAYMVMTARKFPDMPSANWRPRRTKCIIPVSKIMSQAGYSPSQVGDGEGRITAKGQPQQVRPYLKNKLTKKGWGMTQVEDHLPSKHMVLSSNLNTTKSKQNTPSQTYTE